MKNNCMFYFSCRLKLKKNIFDIEKELTELFDENQLPSRLSEERFKIYTNWSNTLSSADDQSSLFSFDGNENFQQSSFLKFQINSKETLSPIQFYSLCRYQLNEKPEKILEELKEIFESEITAITLNSWIVNSFSNLKPNCGSLNDIDQLRLRNEFLEKEYARFTSFESEFVKTNDRNIMLEKKVDELNTEITKLRLLSNQKEVELKSCAVTLNDLKNNEEMFKKNAGLKAKLHKAFELLEKNKTSYGKLKEDLDANKKSLKDLTISLIAQIDANNLNNKISFDNFNSKNICNEIKIWFQSVLEDYKVMKNEVFKLHASLIQNKEAKTVEECFTGIKSLFSELRLNEISNKKEINELIALNKYLEYQFESKDFSLNREKEFTETLNTSKKHDCQVRVSEENSTIDLDLDTTDLIDLTCDDDDGDDETVKEEQSKRKKL